MKRLLTLSIITGLVFAGSTAFAQNKDVQNSQLYRHYQMKYVFGMKYNDSDVAKSALYDMIALDTSDDSLKFNLSYLYLDEGQFASALFISADILSRKPENKEALNINAVCYERMGLRDKAIAAYESLYMLDNSLETLYQMAALQFEIGRYKESRNNAKILVEKPKAKELKIGFQKSERETQEISLEAAGYNLLGMVDKEQGNKAEAKKHFQKAIELYPEFVLAKDNVAELDK